MSIAGTGYAYAAGQVCSPLVVNAALGSIMFTSFSVSLELLHNLDPNSDPQDTRRGMHAYSLPNIFMAGAFSGTIYALLACPVEQVLVLYCLCVGLETAHGLGAVRGRRCEAGCILDAVHGGKWLH